MPHSRACLGGAESQLRLALPFVVMIRRTVTPWPVNQWRPRSRKAMALALRSSARDLGVGHAQCVVDLDVQVFSADAAAAVDHPARCQP